MISTWTIAPRGGAECGNCAQRIEAGQPMERLTRPGLTRVLFRCVVHAHTPMDQAAIDAARHAAEAEAARFAEHPAPVPSLSNTRPTYRPRHTPTKPVTGFTKLSDGAGKLFDPRAAQANDTD